MKTLKPLLLLLLFTLAIPVSSQVYKLRAHSLYITDGYQKSTSEVRININIDTDRQRIVIYSKEIQIIDYTELRHYTNNDGYLVVECTADDSDYVPFHLTLYMHDRLNSVLILLEYANVSYSYACKVL